MGMDADMCLSTLIQGFQFFSASFLRIGFALRQVMKASTMGKAYAFLTCVQPLARSLLSEVRWRMGTFLNSLASELV